MTLLKDIIDAIFDEDNKVESMSILKILETHSFIINNDDYNFWLKYKCSICEKVIHDIVGRNDHYDHYDNTLNNTLTCDEMMIKKILE